MTATKTTTIILTPTTRRQLAEIGGQQSETIRRAVAVLWVLERLDPHRPLASTHEMAQAAEHFCSDPQTQQAPRGCEPRG